MQLKNIGPKTEVWLKRAGINSKAEFIKAGPEKTYKLIIDAGHAENLNLKYALYGAYWEIDWREAKKIVLHG